MEQDKIKGNLIDCARHRAYVGSLDDSVSRYPWIGHTPDLNYFNFLLLENALFGKPICARMVISYTTNHTLQPY